MPPTPSSAPSVAPTPSAAPADADLDSRCLDATRYRLDGGVEHHVAQLVGEERIVATLRIDPARAVPLRELKRLGARTLPDADGARVGLSADDDAAGRTGFALLVATALHARRAAEDDAWWLAACPPALVETALALGWERVPGADDAGDGTVALALVLDDVERLAAIGSPLARVPARPATDAADPGARVHAVREALGLPPAEPAERRAARG